MDPYIPVIEARSWSGNYAITGAPADTRAFGQYDCVVIITDHRSFDYAAMVEGADLVVDTRNAIKVASPNVFRLGAPHPERLTATPVA
jgi:UDP-N-acetyl-D-glucosamine dehydrogenase